MNNQFGIPMGMGMYTGMPMTGMGMPTMGPNMIGGMGMQMNEMDQDWMKGFNLALNEENDAKSYDDNTPGPKMNIIFQTTTGTKHNLVMSVNTTIGEAIKKYLNRVGHPELFNQPDKIGFLFNAQKLKATDQTPISNYFKNSVNPKIIVNDTNNLIGA